MKRVSLRRKPHHDPVTKEVHDKVIARDQWMALNRRRSMNPCVAATLLPDQSPMCSVRLTLDHVKDEPRMGVRAPSDEQHLVTLCSYHHLETGWATSHRPMLRWYLRSIYENPGPSATVVAK